MKPNCYLTLEESSIAVDRSVAWIKKRIIKGELESIFRDEERLVKGSSLENLCGPLSLQSLEIPSERIVHNFLPEEPSLPHDKEYSHKELGKQSVVNNVRRMEKQHNEISNTQKAKSNEESRNIEKGSHRAVTKKKSENKSKSRKKKAKAKARSHTAAKSRSPAPEEKRWREYQAEIDKFKGVLHEIDRQIQQEAKPIEHYRNSGHTHTGERVEKLLQDRRTLIAQYKSRLREIEARGIVITGAWNGINEEFSSKGCGNNCISQISQKPNGKKESSRKSKSKNAKKSTKVIIAREEPLNTFDPRRKLQVWEKPSIARRGTYQSPSR